ncbi:MAG: winged helix DNA-binding domain-containing protein [Actinobacteria bacterium]|nr:MAG: winged helix DNA-binding domain-containing protein [Actinomycetota bacterium]
MAGPERVLSQRELNRALLARQLLLERVRLPLPRAVERIGAIQAQYAPSAYIGLWSRVQDFERAALTRALERRSLVQATVLRGTIHIVSRRDFWPWRAAVGDSDEAWVRRVFPTLTMRERTRANGRLRDALADGVRQRDSLVALVGKDAWNAADVDLVRVPPSGTWERRRADLFALAEDWIGPDDADPDKGRELLVRRYLSAFGPARVADIRSWSRLGPDAVAQALERIGPRRFRDEQGKELVDLPRAPLPDPETPAPVRFLPKWDATLLVHARRTGILAEEHRARIFSSKNPQSESTFLVDGVVGGAWRYQDGRIELEPFGRIPRETRRELKEEAERLAAFHA